MKPADTLLPGNPHCPHVPLFQTWTVVFTGTGDEVTSLTPNTWWPNLTSDLCQLTAGRYMWDIPICFRSASRSNCPYRRKRALGWGVGDDRMCIPCIEVSPVGDPHLLLHWSWKKLGRSPLMQGSRPVLLCCLEIQDYRDTYRNPSSSWNLIMVKRKNYMTRGPTWGKGVGGRH